MVVWRIRTSVLRAITHGARWLIARMPGPLRRWLEAELVKLWLRVGRKLVPAEQLAAVYGASIEDLAKHGASDRLTYFEAGVFAGDSMAILVQAARAQRVAVDAWGVDSFAGLPDAVAGDEGGWVPGSFACPRSVTEWNLKRHGVNPSEFELIEGWFDDVLTPDLAERVGRVDIAMLDADAYSSTVPVLEFLTPILADRSWLVFDDWYSGGNIDPATQMGRGTGVERAFDEWLAAQPGEWAVEQIRTYSVVRWEPPPVKTGMVLRLIRVGSAKR